MTSNFNGYKDFVIWSALSGVGGVVRFLVGRVTTDAPKISTTRYLFLLSANIVISGFTGLLGALLMTKVTADPTWHLIAAGSFGYLGIEGLELIAKKVSKKIA